MPFPRLAGPFASPSRRPDLAAKASGTTSNAVGLDYLPALPAHSHPRKCTPFRSLPTAPPRHCHSLPAVPVIPVFATALTLAWPRTASEDIRIHQPRANQCKQPLLTASCLASDTERFRRHLITFFSSSLSETDRPSNRLSFPACHFCFPTGAQNIAHRLRLAVKHASATRGHRSHSRLRR